MRLGSDVPPNFHEESVNELAEPGNEVIDFNQAKGAQETRSKAEKQSVPRRDNMQRHAKFWEPLAESVKM